MSRRWSIPAALLLAASLGLLCASCDSEAKVNPPSVSPDAQTPQAKQPAGTVVFEEEFERVRLEAEDAVAVTGNRKDKIRLVADEDASGGKCYEIPDKVGKPEDGKYCSWLYRFTVKKAGFYTFWCRRKWLDACGDTLAVRFDREREPRDVKKTEFLFGGSDSKPVRWAWSPVHENGNPRQFFLTAGAHVVEILNREDGPRFDVILLTADRDYVPQGLDD